MLVSAVCLFLAYVYLRSPTVARASCTAWPESSLPDRWIIWLVLSNFETTFPPWKNKHLISRVGERPERPVEILWLRNPHSNILKKSW